MDKKGRLLLQNKTLAFFVDFSILSAAYLSGGLLNFAGAPVRTFGEYLSLLYPTLIVLALEIFVLRKHKKTIGGRLVEKMKLSWLKTVTLIPVSSIFIVYAGAIVISLLSMVVISIVFYVARLFGISTP